MLSTPIFISFFAVDEKLILPYPAAMIKASKSAVKKAVKLTKSDPEFYSKIGKLGGPAVKEKYGTNHFSELARKSHPRAEYHGGRPRKIKEAE